VRRQEKKKDKKKKDKKKKDKKKKDKKKKKKKARLLFNAHAHTLPNPKTLNYVSGEEGQNLGQG
jgi:hypothetical protein